MEDEHGKGGILAETKVKDMEQSQQDSSCQRLTQACMLHACLKYVFTVTHIMNVRVIIVHISNHVCLLACGRPLSSGTRPHVHMYTCTYVYVCRHVHDSCFLDIATYSSQTM